MGNLEEQDELERFDPREMARRERQAAIEGLPAGRQASYPSRLTVPPPRRPPRDPQRAARRRAAELLERLGDEPRYLFPLLSETSRTWDVAGGERQFVARYLVDLGPIGSCSLVHTVRESGRSVHVEQQRFRLSDLHDLSSAPHLAVRVRHGVASCRVEVATVGVSESVSLVASQLASLDSDCAFSARAALELAGATLAEVGEFPPGELQAQWNERNAVVPPTVFVATRILPLLDGVRP